MCLISESIDCFIEKGKWICSLEEEDEFVKNVGGLATTMVWTFLVLGKFDYLITKRIWICSFEREDEHARKSKPKVLDLLKFHALVRYWTRIFREEASILELHLDIWPKIRWKCRASTKTERTKLGVAMKRGILSEKMRSNDMQTQSPRWKPHCLSHPRNLTSR